MEWREVGKRVLVVNPDEFREQFDVLSKPGQHPMVLEEKSWEGRKFQVCDWQPYDPFSKRAEIALEPWLQ